MAAKTEQLSDYNRKRNFSRTPEPAGRVVASKKKNLVFLVQKHAAQRLHYDLRLEWNGVLWSWAVTRGPSNDPATKRLAVRTEDHPVTYKEFEGNIAKGEYGGGTVMLWDQGIWEPLQDPAKGMREGKLHFRIRGDRMKGGWALVRMKGDKSKKGNKENWLLIKERDEEASASPDELVSTFNKSIKSGRTMSAIAKDTNNQKTETRRIKRITITHPERELFQDAGISKYDLALYYKSVSARMLRIAGNHPLSLVRCPQGLSADCFYQKHAGKGFPKQLKRIGITEQSGGSEEYLYVTTESGFIAAVQMGTIEFHVWGSRIDKLEKPDRLVFDLDPDESIGFPEIISAAHHLRKLLGRLGLETVPLVTGGKGIHLCVPLKRTVNWGVLNNFARKIAAYLSQKEPERFTDSMSKSDRKGRIFIDWLRNDRGATAIAPYSVRARQGAPIATPVTWNELKKLNSADSFGFEAVTDRLDKFCPYLKAMDEPQLLGKGTLKALEDLLAGH